MKFKVGDKVRDVRYGDGEIGIVVKTDFRRSEPYYIQWEQWKDAYWCYGILLTPALNGLERVLNEI